MRDLIRADISTTRHHGYRRRVCGSGEDNLGNIFSCLFFGKTKSLSPIVGDLSNMLVKKYELGLLNPVTSANEK